MHSSVYSSVSHSSVSHQSTTSEVREHKRLTCASGYRSYAHAHTRLINTRLVSTCTPVSYPGHIHRDIGKFFSGTEPCNKRPLVTKCSSKNTIIHLSRKIFYLEVCVTRQTSLDFVFPYIHLYSHTLTCIPIHSLVFPYIHLYSHTFTCIPIHSLVLPYIHLYSHTLTCIPIHSLVFPYSGLPGNKTTCVGLTCPLSRNLCGFGVSLLTCLGVQALATRFVSSCFHDPQDDCTDSISLSLYEYSRFHHQETLTLRHMYVSVINQKRGGSR